MEDINKRESDDSSIHMKNIEPKQQQQQGVELFSGDIIIHQLLQATNLFFQLGLQSVLSLTLTCKTLFKPLSSLISQHYIFYYNKHTPLIHYHPKKLKSKTFHINGLFDNNPCLTKVTEIEFEINNYSSGTITNYPFDKAITNILLSLNLITHFKIGWYFNQPINSLSHLSTVTHLEFCFNCGFNHPIDNLLPPNLINLKLSINFNQPINLLYLTKLTNLEFSTYSKFNHSIDHLLPPNLTKLTLGWSFSHPLNHLPLKLTFLKMGGYFSHPIDKLPPNLTHLTILNCTPLQYEHIQKMPSILYFNNEPMMKRNNSDEKKE